MINLYILIVGIILLSLLLLSYKKFNSSTTKKAKNTDIYLKEVNCLIEAAKINKKFKSNVLINNIRYNIISCEISGYTSGFIVIGIDVVTNFVTINWYNFDSQFTEKQNLNNLISGLRDNNITLLKYSLQKATDKII